MERVIFEIENYQMHLGQALLAGIILVFYLFLHFKGIDSGYRFFNLKRFSNNSQFKKLVSWSLLIIFSILLVEVLGLNYILIESKEFDVDVVHVLLAFLIIQISRSLDWIVQELIKHSAEHLHDEADMYSKSEASGLKLVQSILIGFAGLFLIENFGLDRGFSTPIGDNESIVIHVSNIIMAVLVILIARLSYWFITKVFLNGFYHAREVEKGVRFAFNQLIAYIIYTIGILVALQNLGINMNLIWGGAAALLVGIGLGLQQTFADFFAGIMLLFERSVKIGDVLEIDNTKGIVIKIGLRTSIIVTPKEQSIVIPNSLLTNQSVINWSHSNNKLRYEVEVGVAYGSDTAKVKTLLLQSLKGNKSVLVSPKPFVGFTNFGESSLDFIVFFYSLNHLKIEKTKSDIRFSIDDLFRKNNIVIPFPQRDLWIKKE